MYRNIIWDVDGTLFDTYPSIARSYKLALNDLGHDAPLAWLEELGKVSLNHCTTTLIEKFQINEDGLSTKFHWHYDQIRPENQPPFPGVINIYEYIVSIGGKNLIITHRGKEGTEQLLAAHNMTGYFTDCFARDAGFPRKPDPTAFLAMIDKHSLTLNETINIGDRDIDIQAGQAAGLFSCLFTTQASAVKPDLIFRSYDELKETLLIK